jgi:hypothetical protein
MNKIFIIGFLGGLGSILYCLKQNKNENNNKEYKEINKHKVKFNDIKISSDKLIIYEKPRPIYELYLKSEWEIL